MSEQNNGVVVTTKCGEFRGKYGVNAGGLYADELARQVGIDVKITPGKGVMAVFHGRVINAIYAPLTLRQHPRTKGGAIIPIYCNILIGPNLTNAESKDDFLPILKALLLL